MLPDPVVLIDVTHTHLVPFTRIAGHGDNVHGEAA
jgi:hypothetical protein